MSTSKVCKNCPGYIKGSSNCDLHKKPVSQWNDWCDERKSAYEAWKIRGNL